MNNPETVASDIKQKAQYQRLKYPINNIWFILGVMILCLACLVLMLVLNVTIEMPFFIDGVNFIYNIQQALPSPVFKVIFNVISIVCFPYFVAAFLVIYYIVSKRKMMVQIHLVYYFYATFIIALIVQSFQHTRPTWYDLRIKNLQWSCMTTYGNPSGHNFTVPILFQPFISDRLGYGKFKFMSIPLALLLILMPISRMYLGVHSSNQVLFGLILGFISLVFFKYIYQKQLYELSWQFLTQIRSNLKIVALVIMHALTIIIPIVFYIVNLNTRPMLQRDIDNINKQCETSGITSSQVQSGMFVTGCSIGSLPFGFIYGLILLMNRKKYRYYYLGIWHYQRKLKIPLQLLIYLLCAAVPYIIFFVIDMLAVKDTPVVSFLLGSAGALGVGLGIAYLVPILSFKWKVISIGEKEPKGAEENNKAEAKIATSNNPQFKDTQVKVNTHLNVNDL